MLVRMKSQCGVTRPDVVTLSYDFLRNGTEIVLLGDALPPRLPTPARRTCRRGPRSHGSRPSSLPRWTAWVRRAAPSLSKAREQCVLTVFSETKSCVAISRLLRPRATSERISSSRAVMPRVCWWAVLGEKGRAFPGTLPRKAGPSTPRRFAQEGLPRVQALPSPRLFPE